MRLAQTSCDKPSYHRYDSQWKEYCMRYHDFTCSILMDVGKLILNFSWWQRHVCSMSMVRISRELGAIKPEKGSRSR